MNHTMQGCLVSSPMTPRESERPGWQWYRLTDVARLATGHTPSRRCPEYWKGDIPWLQLPDIRAQDGRWIQDTSEHTNQLGLDHSASVLLPRGTVCLSRTASVGFITIMNRSMATSQDFVNWVCGPNLDPEFLMYLFMASRQYIRELGSGATHHSIYFPAVEAFNVCVPAVPEQKGIAAELTKALEVAETIRRAAQERLAAAEALPGAYLREVFEGAEASDWERRCLVDVCEVQLGKMLSPKSKTGIRPIPYLRNENVQWNRFKLDEVAWMDFTEAEEAKFRLKPGDLLVCEGGEPGRAAIWEGQIERCCYQKALHRIRPRAGQIHPPYLMYRLWMSVLLNEFAEAQTQTTISHLPREKLVQLLIAIPALSRQKGIATELTVALATVDKTRRAAQEQLAAIDALPAALLRRAFQGGQG